MASTATAGGVEERSSPSCVPAELRARYDAAGQGHVFSFVDSGRVSVSAAAHLCEQLAAVDVSLVAELFEATLADEAASKAAAAAPGAAAAAAAALAPPPGVVRARGNAEAGSWWAGGLAAVARGAAAALTLAGGQGTRLGFARPKGEYDIGLPSGKSLFQLQAERLHRVRVLAAAATGAAVLPPLPWYIMTSPMTDADTRAFFEEHKFFGLPREDVRLFTQGTLPCLDERGRMLLESGAALAQAPDGNGGLYRALHLSGAAADMRARGVEGVHVFAVDNAIVRPADPEFIGFCAGRAADVGSKVCAKAGPHERVGVLCLRAGAYAVVEYSELDRALAESRDVVTGELLFNAGNLCMHYFSTDFLFGACAPANLPKVYHLARKAIPFAHQDTGATTTPAAPNGIKLESFIFDVFPASQRMAALEIAREDEFAPVKNAPGAADDSPDTARALVLAQHARWLSAAGAVLEPPAPGAPAVAEVSPLLSYGGEGLRGYAGKVIRCPALLLGPGERADDFAASAARGVNIVAYVASE